MVRVPRLVAALLAVAALACTANAGDRTGSGDRSGDVRQAGSWRELIHDAHLGSVLEAEKRAAAHNESLPPDAYGLGDLPQARELLDAPALPLRRADLPGEWRCRSLQVNRSGVFVYPFFRCRITAEKGRLLFDKLTGSQRRSGELSEAGPDRFVFLGGATVNDEPRRPYSTAQTDWDGESTESDTVGVLTRKGEDRLLMILDATADAYELYELRRDGAKR
jgi:hypothetical protein